jgi:hypothetical protein
MNYTNENLNGIVYLFVGCATIKFIIISLK